MHGFTTYMYSCAIHVGIFSCWSGTCPISNRCFLDPIFSFPETMYFFHMEDVGTSHHSLAVPIVLESKMSCSKVWWVTWILVCHNGNIPICSYSLDYGPGVFSLSNICWREGKQRETRAERLKKKKEKKPTKIYSYPTNKPCLEDI